MDGRFWGIFKAGARSRQLQNVVPIDFTHTAGTDAFAMTFDPVSTPFHAIAAPGPLSGSLEELYSIYFEVARRDHAVRRAALYGKQTPPPGHTPFRPLPFEHFQARFNAASAVRGGEEMFRKQLARQAMVYGVSVQAGSNRRAA